MTTLTLAHILEMVVRPREHQWHTIVNDPPRNPENKEVRVAVMIKYGDRGKFWTCPTHTLHRTCQGVVKLKWQITKT